MHTKILAFSKPYFCDLFESHADKTHNYQVIQYDPEVGDLLQTIIQNKPSVLMIELASPAYIFQNMFEDLQKLGIQIPYIFFMQYQHDKIYYATSELSSHNRLANYIDFFETALQAKYKCMHLNVLDENWKDLFNLDKDYYVRNERIAEFLRGVSFREFKLYREKYRLDFKNCGYYLFICNLAPFEYLDHSINKEVYYFVGHSFAKEIKNALDMFNGGEVLYSNHNMIYVIINDFGQISIADRQKQLEELINKLCDICKCQTSCLYLSERIDSIKGLRVAYDQYKKIKNLAFFCKDVRVLTDSYVRKTKVDVDYSSIHDLLDQIKDAIEFQTSVEETSKLIIKLFMGYIKRSYNFSLYFYCFSSIIGMLDKALGITVAQVAVKEQTLSRFASIEQETAKLISVLETLGRHRSAANISAFVFDTITFIKQHYAEDLLVSDIAKHLHVSCTYLSQLFKRNVGKSIIQYLIEYRIEQAKKLLISTNERITDIATKVGFRDTCHFSKTFHKIVGVSPSQYKLKNVEHKKASSFGS